MYIQFDILVDYSRDRVRAELAHELQKWAHQHSIDYHSIKHRIHDYRVSIELPSTKAYELFCISWCPEKTAWRDYRLIRNG